MKTITTTKEGLKGVISSIDKALNAMITIDKEYVIRKENWSEYKDNKTRYYSILDNEYFDSVRPLSEAIKYAKNKGYVQLRVIYPSFRKKDKLINLN